MKPLSSKFANLGQSDIARRIESAGPKRSKRSKEPKKTPTEATLKMAEAKSPADADRVTKWREANKVLYLKRQRAYAKKYRAKKKAEAK